MELAESFFAGAAQVDITPPLGTIINGDFKAHYAQVIHDPLFAKAVVIRSGKVIAAFVVIDICVMPKDFVDSIRKTIAADLDIPFENILISSTHTHAAGSVAEAYLSAVDAGYKKSLPPLIGRAVGLAKSKMEPAKIGFGKFDVPEHVRSRRYFMAEAFISVNPVNGKVEKVKTNPFGVETQIVKPATPSDPELSYFAIQNLKGEWLTVLANYSLHYVGDWENGTITADYFGEFAAHLKTLLNADENFIGIMSNGTSGDINIWEFINENHYPSQHFEKSKLIGKDLAERLKNSIAAIRWEKNPEIRIAYTELALKCRKPNAEDLAHAKQIVAGSTYENLTIDEEGLKKIYAREQLLLNEYPESIHFPVQAIQIGETIIGALAGEIFASTGLWLKANCNINQYFTISMANGNCGYVPPKHEFKNGGYETWRSRTSYLEEDAASHLQHELVDVIKRLTAFGKHSNHN